jgi:hypothetical protein
MEWNFGSVNLGNYVGLNNNFLAPNRVANHIFSLCLLFLQIISLFAYVAQLELAGFQAYLLILEGFSDFR